jgi:hypothetical protein
MLIVEVGAAYLHRSALIFHSSSLALQSSSLADFSFLLDPPAGKHGFLTVDRLGRFAWPSGSRARFWGVNISGQSVFVDDDVIERVCDTLAHSGANMVRFEAIDAPGGIVDPGGAFAQDRLDALDRWTASLRKRGIYYYFDLLDLRTFTADDGVVAPESIGRAARPYAMFDPTLIRLQKDYASRLLTHRNPHTGLRYVDDPALALVEICNESGFFLRPTELERMRTALNRPEVPLAPYARELNRRWNRWLAARYDSREALIRAWRTTGERTPLDPDEHPARLTVRMPSLSSAGSSTGKRVADFVRFLSELQRAYFREMRAHLRSLGLRVPVTGVTGPGTPGDALSWEPLDFTAGNCFQDHPVFLEQEWVGSIYFNDTNPLRSSSVYGSAPAMAALRWGIKPAVVREWAQPWPNRYRAVAAPEVMAYASLQNLDGLLLFGYRTIPPASGVPALADFAHEADPTVWRMFGPCALAYLRGYVEPGRTRVDLRFTPNEIHTPGGQLPNRLCAAWRDRVQCSVGTSPMPSPLPPPFTLRSSTGQIVRDTAAGVLTVNAPCVAAIAGEIGARPWTLATPGSSEVEPAWRLVTRSPIGALMIVSLDGKPLAVCQRWLITMVTEAMNSDQRIEPQAGTAPGKFRVAAVGRAPVLTGGRALDGGMRLERRGRPWLTLDLVGGTWEALVEGERVTIVCDTDEIRGRLRDRPFVTRADQPLVLDAASGAPR